MGHTIDGRVLFPATGYLVCLIDQDICFKGILSFIIYICIFFLQTLIWKTYAKVQGTQMEETPIILENVQFHRATIMPKEGTSFIKALPNIDII